MNVLNCSWIKISFGKTQMINASKIFDLPKPLFPISLVPIRPSQDASNILGVDSGDGFIAFGEGDGCQLIWNTSVSKWVIVANNGTTTG